MSFSVRLIIQSNNIVLSEIFYITDLPSKQSAKMEHWRDETAHSDKPDVASVSKLYEVSKLQHYYSCYQQIKMPFYDLLPHTTSVTQNRWIA